jgi:lipopolysaccharide biosynthesis glycosyltransferase
VRSLLEHHVSSQRLEITIIDGGLSSDDRRRLESSWEGATSAPARWKFTAPRFHSADELPVWGRVPQLTYARLSLGDYFEADEERAVLLDSDMLVLADIATFHDSELHGAVIGACRDPFIPTVSSIDGLADWQGLGLASDMPYFNAGAMVVDLDQWRRQRITVRVAEFIDRYRDRLNQYDQDGLNAILAGAWTELDPRWQCHPRVEHALGVRRASHPFMIHFSGRLKPWLYNAGHPFDRLFFDVLDRTEWRGFRPDRTLRSLAMSLYDSPLRRLFYPLEVRLMSRLRELQKIGLPWKS